MLAELKFAFTGEMDVVDRLGRWPSQTGNFLVSLQEREKDKNLSLNKSLKTFCATWSKPFSFDVRVS